MKILLTIMILASSCGPAASECWLAQGSVYSYSERLGMDCLAMRQNWNLARSTLVGNGVIPDADFDKAFSGVSVHVRNSLHWDMNGESVVGEYDSGEISVNLTADALVHEMLHRWEDLNKVKNTDTHPDWTIKQYFVYSQVYSEASRPPFQGI